VDITNLYAVFFALVMVVDLCITDCNIWRTQKKRTIKKE